MDVPAAELGALDKTTAYGLDFMFPRRDRIVGRCLARYGEFARAEVDYLLALASSPVGAFVDVGANIGAICLPFAQARPLWSVVAIEAHRGLARVLTANAATNRLHNVSIVQAAAGPERRTVEFPDPRLGADINFGRLGIGLGSNRVAETEMVPLDELAGADVRLVKMDIEGFEPDALAGSVDLLNATRPAWFIEANTQQASEAIARTMMDAEYRLFWFFAPFTGHPTLKGETPDQPAGGDLNIVALPQGVDEPWGLSKLRNPEDPRPLASEAFPYLSSYGFK